MQLVIRLGDKEEAKNSFVEEIERMKQKSDDDEYKKWEMNKNIFLNKTLSSHSWHCLLKMEYFETTVKIEFFVKVLRCKYPLMI